MGVQSRLLFLLFTLLVIASNVQAKKIKKPHRHGLHHHYYELLGLLAFKAKAAFVVGSVVVLLFLMKGFGMFKEYRCPKSDVNHDIIHYSSSPHDTSPPLYHHDFDRYSKGGLQGRNYKIGQQDDLTMFGFDLVDTSFNIVDIRSDICRRKFVCDVDRTAENTPILQYVLKYFAKGLNRYRDVNDPNRPCKDLYPECPGMMHEEEPNETN